MGKFFNGKVRKNRASFVKIAIVVGGILLIFIILIIISKSNSSNSGSIELYESINVELNGMKPEKKDFFSKVEDYDINTVTIDFNNFDISKVGSYTVKILTKDKGSGEVTVNVVDTTEPNLKVKDVTINEGNIYDPYYFVESCSDNSEEECIVEFYSNFQDQYNEFIDYSSFTLPGTYNVKIIAKDASENTTQIMDALLTIEGEITSIEPTNCQYGTLEYNSDDYEYPMAIIVGDENNNCALDRNIWDNETTQIPANDFFNVDYKKLQEETKTVFEEEYPNGANIKVDAHNIAIWNSSNTGLVGYAIYVKVYVSHVDSEEPIDSTDNLKLAYYLNSDYTRMYDVNVFNLD